MKQGFLGYLSSRETLQQMHSGKAAVGNLEEMTCTLLRTGTEPNRVLEWVGKKRKFGRTEEGVSIFNINLGGKPTEEGKLWLSKFQVIKLFRRYLNSTNLSFWIIFLKRKQKMRFSQCSNKQNKIFAGLSVVFSNLIYSHIIVTKPMGYSKPNSLLFSWPWGFTSVGVASILTLLIVNPKLLDLSSAISGDRGPKSHSVFYVQSPKRIGWDLQDF